MRKLLAILVMSSMVFLACEKDDGVLGGVQSPQGEVGNTFTVSNFIQGLDNISAEVIELSNGVSTVRGSATVTNQVLLDIINHQAAKFPNEISVNGNTVTIDAKVRFTKDGIAAVYDEGELVVVKYDAGVGEQFSLTVDGKKLTTEVVSKSSTDDYFWGGLLIKVSEVEFSGHDLPGVEKVTYFANHRFGLVGVRADLNGGGSLQSSVFSGADN